MRKIDYLVIHSTATPDDWTVKRLKDYFLHDLAWDRCGYHRVIDRQGIAISLVDISRPSYGVRQNRRIGVGNYNSINVAYMGGYGGIDNRTKAQKETLLGIVNELLIQFPSIKVVGHRQINNTKCPQFDIKEIYPYIPIVNHYLA